MRIEKQAAASGTASPSQRGTAEEKFIQNVETEGAIHEFSRPKDQKVRHFLKSCFSSGKVTSTTISAYLDDRHHSVGSDKGTIDAFLYRATHAQGTEMVEIQVTHEPARSWIIWSRN